MVSERVAIALKGHLLMMDSMCRGLYEVPFSNRFNNDRPLPPNHGAINERTFGLGGGGDSVHARVSAYPLVSVVRV